MTTANYSTIRFIGYAISTFPAHLRDGYGGGTYLGNDDIETDINARIEILKHAVHTARAHLPRDEDQSKVINVFMVPEFYFHGPQGPYIYDSPENDPIPKILAALLKVFDAKSYPNWTFVFGTAITAKIANAEKLFASESVIARNETVKFLVGQEKKSSSGICQVISNTLQNFITACQSYPDVTVRDRSLIISNILLDSPAKELRTNQMTTEKYFISREDFVLFDTNGRKDIITEQMVAYQHIDLSNGDIKYHTDDAYSIFRQNYGNENSPKYMDFGVEICLDHDDQRLRINLGKEPFLKPEESIHIQLIPSCGMLIEPASVVVNQNGFVFNCDGQYPLDSSRNQVQQGTMGGVNSVYINYNANPTDAYNFHCAHTQLARVQTPAQGNDPNKNSATFQTLATNDIVSISVKEPKLTVGKLCDYFAGGSGEIHIYGQACPYVLYPH